MAVGKKSATHAVGAAAIALAAVAGLAAAGNGGAPLIDAVKAGRAAEVRTLLKQRADVNVREPDGTSPLHWAVRADDRETTELLLKAGANAQAANRYGVTPLSLAASNGNAAIVQALLKAGADANTSLPEGETALMAAARAGDRATVAALVDAGAAVNVKENWLGETALMWAAAYNHPDVVSLLVERGAALDERSAVQEFARFRFNLATMVNTVLPRGSMTALMFAAREGALDGARALTKAGAALDLVDPDDTTAMVLAIMNGHYDVAKLLAESGANPNIGDTSGMAALYAAVDMHTQPLMINRPTRKPSGAVDNLELLKTLLARGANPNAELKTPLLARYHNTGDGQLGAGATPLMRAAKSLDVAAMRLLLDAGASPSMKTRTGTTPLMFAAGAARGKPEKDALDAVGLCLDRGADVNATTDAGQAALHLAVEQSDAVVSLLVARGAKLDLKDRQGKTPLDLALADAPAGRGGRPRAAGDREATAALLRRLSAGSGAK